MNNAPFDYLQPGDGLVRGMNTLVEAHRNSVRPVEDAATQSILSGLQDRLSTSVAHTYAGDAYTFAAQAISDTPDMPYREVRMLINKVTRAAIAADAQSKNLTEAAKELRRHEFQKDLIRFKAEATGGLAAVGDATAE